MGLSFYFSTRCDRLKAWGFFFEVFFSSERSAGFWDWLWRWKSLTGSRSLTARSCIYWFFWLIHGFEDDTCGYFFSMNWETGLASWAYNSFEGDGFSSLVSSIMITSALFVVEFGSFLSFFEELDHVKSIAWLSGYFGDYGSSLFCSSAADVSWITGLVFLKSLNQFLLVT